MLPKTDRLVSFEKKKENEGLILAADEKKIESGVEKGNKDDDEEVIVVIVTDAVIVGYCSLNANYLVNAKCQRCLVWIWTESGLCTNETSQIERQCLCSPKQPCRR